MKKYRNFLIFLLTIGFVSCSDVSTSLPDVPPANANYEKPPMLNWISKFGLDSFFKININQPKPKLHKTQRPWQEILLHYHQYYRS